MADLTSPYRIPDPPPVAILRDWWTERRASASLLGKAVFALVAAFVLGVAGGALSEFAGRTLAFIACGLTAVLALAGCVRGLVAIGRALGTRGEDAPGPAGYAGLVVLVLTNGLMVFLGALGTLLSTVTFTRGRQLRRHGRVLLPTVREGDLWAAPSPSLDVDAQVREGLARQWRENGRTEHASVAAFARLSLDLIALGAPPTLLLSANRDALDEIRHAEICFAIARSIDGKPQSPGPFPEAQRARTLPHDRTRALAALAVDSLIDGALHEGVSARILARLARRAVDPTIASALKSIAADEGRHAAHGWDVVEWCLAEGGRPVADALRGALAVLPSSMTSPLPEEARDGGWERYGIHGRSLETEEFAKGRAALLRRVAELVGTPRAAA